MDFMQVVPLAISAITAIVTGYALLIKAPADRDKISAEAVKLLAEARAIELDTLTKAYEKAREASREIVGEYIEEAERRDARHQRELEQRDERYQNQSNAQDKRIADLQIRLSKALDEIGNYRDALKEQAEKHAAEIADLLNKLKEQGKEYQAKLDEAYIEINSLRDAYARVDKENKRLRLLVETR